MSTSSYTQPRLFLNFLSLWNVWCKFSCFLASLLATFLVSTWGQNFDWSITWCGDFWRNYCHRTLARCRSRRNFDPLSSRSGNNKLGYSHKEPPIKYSNQVYSTKESEKAGTTDLQLCFSDSKFAYNYCLWNWPSISLNPLRRTGVRWAPHRLKYPYTPYT